MDISRKRITLLSAYHTASHKYWADGLVEHLSEYQWQQLSLPPRYFQWRVRGNPLSWNAQLQQVECDAVIATSMVDMATIRACNPNIRNLPWLYYVHENQFVYPVQPNAPETIEPKMVQIYAALAADRIVFNSRYNQQTFITGMGELITKMPDHKPNVSILCAQIETKSCVLPVPIQPVNDKIQILENNAPLHLLWNHRWEYDKGPEVLLEIVKKLAAQKIDFQLSIVGQQFRQIPKPLTDIQQNYGEYLANFGHIENREEYLRLLDSADVVLSTAHHDFQGLSVMEAINHGCYALLPKALAYPEYANNVSWIEANLHDVEQAAKAYTKHLANINVPHLRSQRTRSTLQQYQWNNLASAYKNCLELLLAE